MKERKNISVESTKLERVDQELTTELEISPPVINDNPYSAAAQGPVTNILASRAHVKGRDFVVDEAADKIALKYSMMHINQVKVDLTIFLTEASQLRQSAQRLFCFLMKIFTERSSRRTEVVFSLSEYMKCCNLKDSDRARNQVRKDLDSLSKIRLNIIPESNQGTKLANIAVLDIAVLEKGIIFITFATALHGILQKYSVMPLHPETLKFNIHNNPNSYYFLIRLQQHKYMNIGKDNEDIISVGALLDCSELPSYDKAKKHVGQRIIDPFTRDMDAIQEKGIFRWEFCHSKGIPLTDKEISDLTYRVFSEAFIKVYWLNYPDQTKRLQNKRDKSKLSNNKGSRKPHKKH